MGNDIYFCLMEERLYFRLFYEKDWKVLLTQSEREYITKMFIWIWYEDFNVKLAIMQGIFLSYFWAILIFDLISCMNKNLQEFFSGLCSFHV